ncbi:MAG: hypothetical protein IIU14_00090 [Ruminococcus sp.]|nr:hypothetical protein [Ruminococcus sp.]
MRKLSFLFLVFAIVFAILAAGCLVSQGFVRDSQYDEYLAAAKKQTSEAENDYLEAIKLDPTDVRAYGGLVSLYLDSEEKAGKNLSEAEFKVISLLTEPNEEALIASDSKSYGDDVLYPVSTALFLSYGGSSREKSVEMLAKAAQYTSDADRKAFCKALKTVAEYRVSLDSGKTISLTEYSNSLGALCATKLLTSGNSDEVLKTCRFVLSELEKGVFKNSEVSDESQKKLVSSAKSLLETVSSDSKLKTSLLNKCNKLSQTETKTTVSSTTAPAATQPTTAVLSTEATTAKEAQNE